MWLMHGITSALWLQFLLKNMHLYGKLESALVMLVLAWTLFILKVKSRNLGRSVRSVESATLTLQFLVPKAAVACRLKGTLSAFLMCRIEDATCTDPPKFWRCTSQLRSDTAKIKAGN